MLYPGNLFVVAAPSGTGKSSLVKSLLELDSHLTLCISHTTRPSRGQEQNGREYHFISREDFQAKIRSDDFIEWAEVHGNLYGTSRAAIQERITLGEDIILEIDWQGAAQVRQALPDDSVSVFILPPSWADLARRLHARAQDADAVIQRRLGRGREEITHWGDYDYVIVNKNFDRAYADLGHIYRAERMKPSRNPWLPDFVRRLGSEST
jgi:guanylate kinase